MEKEKEVFRQEFLARWLSWDQRHMAPSYNGQLGRCCEKAEEMTCVCEAAWTCPEHGILHVGTHD